MVHNRYSVVSGPVCISVQVMHSYLIVYLIAGLIIFHCKFPCLTLFIIIFCH